MGEVPDIHACWQRALGITILSKVAKEVAPRIEINELWSKAAITCTQSECELPHLWATPTIMALHMHNTKPLSLSETESHFSSTRLPSDVGVDDKLKAKAL